VGYALTGPAPAVAFQVNGGHEAGAEADPGTHFKHLRPTVRADRSGGWGLLLVDRIANSWGVGRSMSGSCVWFEIEFER
jgi:hypothetical protein